MQINYSSLQDVARKDHELFGFRWIAVYFVHFLSILHRFIEQVFIVQCVEHMECLSHVLLCEKYYEYLWFEAFMIGFSCTVKFATWRESRDREVASRNKSGMERSSNRLTRVSRQFTNTLTWLTRECRVFDITWHKQNYSIPVAHIYAVDWALIVELDCHRLPYAFCKRF